MIQSTPNPAYVRYNSPSGAILDPEKQVMLKDSLTQTKDTLTKSTDDNPAVKAAQDTTNDPKVLLGALGFWVFLKEVVKPLNKAIAGNYDKSLLGKIGSFGDRVSDALHLEVFASKTGGISKRLGNSRLFKYFSSSYKTAPKNTFAAAMMNGTLGELSSDASSVINACKEQGKDLSKLFNMNELDDILKSPLENKGKLIKALRKASPEEFIEFGGKFKMPFIGEVSIPIFKRKVYFSELANKLTAVSKNGPNTLVKNGVKVVENAAEIGAKTALGKTASKGFLRTMEGLTNGMAGGPAAILIQAFCFAQATKAAIEAPKGEKISTFMENVFQDLGYYLVSAPSINLLHKAAGNKYRGMTVENLAKYKNLIKTTSEAATNGALDKAAYKAAKAEAKTLLKGTEKLKLWERPLKFAGKLLGAGLDKINPLIKATDSSFVKTLKQIGSKAKGFPGGLGRFAVVMFAITPVLVKPIVKLSHLIFGRPTKSVLDKEEDKKEIKPADQAAVQNAANQQPGSSNYLDIYSNKPQSPQEQVSSAAPMAPESSEEIAARKIKKDKNEKDSDKPVRTYVPSSVPTQFPDTGEDASKLDAILRKADFIENEVLKNV